eukprot:gene10785-3402_t
MMVKEKETKTEYEFGGPIGAVSIIIFSHFIPYYLWYCTDLNNGVLALPSLTMLKEILHHIQPNYISMSLYLGFILFEAFLAWIIPGFEVEGLPLKHEGNKKLKYNCNAFQAWWITLSLIGVFYYTNVFKISVLVDYLPSLMLISTLFADFLALYLFFYTLITKNEHRMSGNFIYDFFMGASLNPRIGTLDLKMFAEARVSWILLFLLTLSSAMKQYETLGEITNSMWFILTAHFLYVNAIMKGEECIPTTWDIFYEKFGFMLIFWNFSGVPFVYYLQSFYIYKYSNYISVPSSVMITFFIILFFCYYIWDTAQSQRNRFRMMINNSYKYRYTFPQLPWGTLENPKYMDTKSGSKLLVDGWWRYARKIHYTVDICMAFLWGACCGLGSPIPYFYFCFFTGMIIHRANRDIHRCSQKYKTDWDRYCEKVPYLFVPFVY